MKIDEGFPIFVIGKFINEISMAREKKEDKKEDIIIETKAQQDFSKIQAVKELIFGPDIQTIEDQFKALNERIDDLQNQLIDESNSRESSVHELETKTENVFAKFEDKMQKELDSLKDKKTDRAVLGKLLIQIGEKLQS